MTLDDLISLLERKIAYLQQQKSIFLSFGDIEKVVSIEQEIAAVEVALSKLKS